MKRVWMIVAALIGGVLVSEAACGVVIIGRNQFYIRDGKLVRGRTASEFMIRGIDTPGLADPKTLTPGTLAQTLARLSEVGANTVCFDLCGLSPDGTRLSEEGVEALRTVMRQVNWRNLGALCKVLGADAPADPGLRLTVAKTVAKALRADNNVIYWIDGPDAAKLVKVFRKEAPELVVAAPEGGDLTILPHGSAASSGLPLMLGALPAPISGPGHCLLPDSPASYDAYEKAMADPIESQPWTPDNSVLSEDERKDGWIALFDGKTLNGWTITGRNKQGFIVRDGLIEWNGGGGGMLRTRDRYDNFILRLEYKLDKGKNSGILLRTPRVNRASKIGFEFQLMGDFDTPPNKNSTGSVYDVVAPLVSANKPADEWNTVEIALDGPHLKAQINGQTVQDVNFDDNEELLHRLRRGFIGLQDHNGQVFFRNIRLKKL